MQVTRRFIPETGELTIYSGETLSDADDLGIGAMIMTAFQDMKVEKVKMITDMMHEEGFTKQRAIDAVKRVIKDHIAWGHEPNIGNFIGFDQRVKTLTYAEITKQQYDGSLSWDDYQSVDVGLDKPRWARIEDVRRYGLKEWKL